MKKFKDIDFKVGVTVGDFEFAFKRKPKDIEEWENFAHYCKNGMDAQLDWDMIITCAKQAMEK